MSSFYISAAHKSSGKTSVSIGLAGAMLKRGLAVQTFKRGPDYIDPIWLASASGSPCYNLDFNTQNLDEIKNLFRQKSNAADAYFVEGNKGLFDGVDLAGADSNAALAKLLGLPVVLVIDCMGMTRGIAPLLLGYKAFDKDVNIAGVILNKTGGTRHEEKLRAAVENYTDIPVLGVLPKAQAMEIPERHLGLMPANEMKSADKTIANIISAVENGVDVAALMALGKESLPDQAAIATTPAADITIAVARDKAFGFYYPDDLEAFKENGANIVFFDAIEDSKLPKCDGLFIGGGFPETQIAALNKNTSMLASIKTSLEAGLPCYAECGGLMYLSNSISFAGQSADMVGFIPATVNMHKKPQGRGFVELVATSENPWSELSDTEEKLTVLPAHEFHYAELTGLPLAMKYAYKVKRGFGIDGTHDGLILGNSLASFSHLRNTEKTPWVLGFLNFVRSKQSSS